MSRDEKKRAGTTVARFNSAEAAILKDAEELAVFLKNHLKQESAAWMVRHLVAEWGRDRAWANRLHGVIHRLEKEVRKLWIGLFLRKRPEDMEIKQSLAVKESLEKLAATRTPSTSTDVDALLVEARARVAAATPGPWGMSRFRIGPDRQPAGMIVMVLAEEADEAESVSTVGWITNPEVREEDVRMMASSKRLVTMLADALEAEREKKGRRKRG